MVKVCLIHRYFISFVSILAVLMKSDVLPAQDNGNLDFLLKTMEHIIAAEESTSSVPVEFPSRSETKLIGIFLIKFYQSFISTQDKPSCNFTLSCSHFGIEAIKHRGFIAGSLLTADRLTRCNSLALRFYRIDPVTKKAIDNVPEFEFNENQSSQRDE